MPSQKNLETKQAQVEKLTGELKSSVAGVLVDYSGISVADDTKLRRELREAGISYEVVKNSVIERATANVGLLGFHDHLHGSSALAISHDD
ncbi:MAG: 50S ribosomal protein L10, partial [Oscillospiraceae bacterium]